MSGSYIFNGSSDGSESEMNSGTATGGATDTTATNKLMQNLHSHFKSKIPPPNPLLPKSFVL